MRFFLMLVFAEVLLTAQPLMVKPKEALVPCGQTVQFRIAGQEPRTIRWRADRGKIDETGLFTAPSEHGPCHITACDQQDINRSATAEVRAVEISLRSQHELFLRPKEEGRIEIQLAFRGGDMDRKLTWSFEAPVNEEEDGLSRKVSQDGELDATGWVRAPSTEGYYPIRITLSADPRIHTTTFVRVAQPRSGRVNAAGESVVVKLQPTETEINSGTYTSFSAYAAGSDTDHLTWSIVDGPKDGQLDQQGVFTAARAGTYRLRATSFIYPECWGEATVVVKPSVEGILKEEDAPKGDFIGATVIPAPRGGYLTIGGWTGTKSSSEVHFLNLETKTLKVHMNIQGPRTRCLAARLSGGTFLLVGGIGADGKTPLKNAERMDIERKVSWQVGTPRWFHIGGILQALPGGRALLIGGCEPSGKPCGVEEFNSAKSAFRTLDERPWPSHAASVLLKNGRLLLLGGEVDRRPVALVWSIDPETETFTPIGKLAEPRSRASATLRCFDKEEVVVIGGRGIHGTLATVERLDPAKGSSRPGGKLAEPREQHAALLIPTGQILVFGGGNGAKASRLLEDWSSDENAAAIRDHMEMGAWLPSLYLNPDGSTFVSGLAEAAMTTVVRPEVWGLWD